MPVCRICMRELEQDLSEDTDLQPLGWSEELKTYRTIETTRLICPDHPSVVVWHREVIEGF